MISIDAHNLAKIYRLYQSPALRIKEIILRRPFHTEFAALEDINFSVLAGETLGIIGENGAGKSTLLKILAKTLKPTAGALTIHGRSSALLELGAGFNPELSGEENIYLNAYLLGLSREEIDAKKQEIIDFSELDEFIGRPVKTYSSGMHVRLAFSIATMVNPEILIIDEALSVGDEYFQKKCIDRMMQFRKQGKTIVLCSHNMYYIQELCQKTMWLHRGKVRGIGETGKVIVDYQNYARDKAAIINKKNAAEEIKAAESGGGKLITVSDVKVTDATGRETETFETFGDIYVSFRVCCARSDVLGHLAFFVIRNDEITVFGTTTQFDGLEPVRFVDNQEFRVRMRCELLSGIYVVQVYVGDDHAMYAYDTKRTNPFSVVNGSKEFGMVHMEHEWLL